MYFSERLVVHHRHVALGGWGTGWTFVCAFWAGATLVLLFWARAGGDCGGRGGGRSSLFFKVCDYYRDVSHCYSKLLCGTSVYIFQPGPGDKKQTEWSLLGVEIYCYKSWPYTAQTSSNSSGLVDFWAMSCHADTTRHQIFFFTRKPSNFDWEIYRKKSRVDFAFNKMQSQFWCSGSRAVKIPEQNSQPREILLSTLFSVDEAIHLFSSVQILTCAVSLGPIPHY